MTDASINLAGVAPKKLEQARRRAATIAAFAALKHPTRPLAQAYAARLGLKEAQFYNLVRVFREKGTIVRELSPERRKAAPSIDARVDAVINAAIKRMGSDAPLSEVIAETFARCANKNLPRPSMRAIQTRLARARRTGGGSTSYPPLVLDRAPLELNVVGPAALQAAWLTALIHAPSAKVLGHFVSAGEAGPREAALAIIDAIGPDGSRGLPADTLDDAITLFRDLHPEWPLLASALTEAGLTVVGPVRERVRVGTAMLRLLGDRIGRIAMRPRLPAGQPSKDGGDGVDLTTAQTAVRQVLAAHGALTALAGDVDERLRALAVSLSRVAAA